LNKITQHYWNRYQTKIKHLDITSADIKQMDKPFHLKAWEKVRAFFQRPSAQIVSFLILTGLLIGE